MSHILWKSVKSGIGRVPVYSFFLKFHLFKENHSWLYTHTGEVIIIWVVFFHVHSGTNWTSFLNRSVMSGLLWPTELVCSLWCCTKLFSMTLWRLISVPTRIDSRSHLHLFLLWITVQNMTFECQGFRHIDIPTVWMETELLSRWLF